MSVFVYSCNNLVELEAGGGGDIKDALPTTRCTEIYFQIIKAFLTYSKLQSVDQFGR